MIFKNVQIGHTVYVPLTIGGDDNIRRYKRSDFVGLQEQYVPRKVVKVTEKTFKTSCGKRFMKRTGCMIGEFAHAMKYKEKFGIDGHSYSRRVFEAFSICDAQDAIQLICNQ